MIEIEALLSGEPLRKIAKQFSLSAVSVHRHLQGHLRATLAKSHEAAERFRADALLEQLDHLAEDAQRIQHKAESAED